MSKTTMNGVASEKDVKPKGGKGNDVAEAIKIDPKDIKKKEDLPLATEAKPGFKALTVEERSALISNAFNLTEKLIGLKQTEAKFSAFSHSSDKMTEKLKITDAKGVEFAINNSQIIKNVVDVLRLEIKIRIEEVENQILTSQI